MCVAGEIPGLRPEGRVGEAGEEKVNKNAKKKQIKLNTACIARTSKFELEDTEDEKLPALRCKSDKVLRKILFFLLAPAPTLCCHFCLFIST